MISAAVGRGGETMISAQTIEAYWNAMKRVNPIAIGLNCSLGPDLMRPFLAELAEKSNTAISCYPNAGLPNPLSPTGFDLKPEDMGNFLGEFAQSGLLNIAGGCCGNTPEHIAAIAKALEGRHPREFGAPASGPARSKSAAQRAGSEAGAPIEPRPLRLSGSQPFTQPIGSFTMICEHAHKVLKYGAAVVVMAFDEQGQAATLADKIRICECAYRILVDEVGFPPEDIIFDPNILTVGTGIEEHNNYAVDFIEATRWIKNNLPHAKVSGGVSNVSFGFRGNNPVREAMHSAFLYHAIKAGMDMGIVNAGMLEVYEEIEPELKELVEDVLLNRRPDATERLVEHGDKLKATSAGTTATDKKVEEEWRKGTIEERLSHSLVKGIDAYVDADTAEALAKYVKPLTVIERPLMAGVSGVG